MIHFIYFNSCQFHHRIYYELKMACSPVALINGLNVAYGNPKAGVRIPAKHEIFQVLFQPLTLGCLFYCEDHVHFLFVNATKGLLTLLYLKRKIHNRLTGSTRTLHMIPTRMLSTLRSKIPSTSGTWQKLKAET